MDDEKKNWRETLELRERKEVELAEMYVKEYNHGHQGHLAMTVIAKLAKLLDEVDHAG